MNRQAEPANLIALEQTLRWRCWTEGLGPCMGCVPTLRAAVPRRTEDAAARVAALHFSHDMEAMRVIDQRLMQMRQRFQASR